MDRYERLMSEHQHLRIYDNYEIQGNLKGFYTDGIIAIDKNISSAFKLEVLAEEIAHSKLTYGNILDQSKFNNRKFEGYARRHAMEQVISLQDIIDAELSNCHNLYEMANFFEVSECFVQQCIANYKKRYGLSTLHNGYLIQFEPLRVFEYKKY